MSIKNSLEDKPLRVNSSKFRDEEKYNIRSIIIKKETHLVTYCGRVAIKRYILSVRQSQQ